MGAHSSVVLLERISRAKCEKQIMADVLELFDQFDRDRSGHIDGYEVGSLIDFLAKYVVDLLLEHEPTAPATRRASVPTESLSPLVAMTIARSASTGRSPSAPENWNIGGAGWSPRYPGVPTPEEEYGSLVGALSPTSSNGGKRVNPKRLKMKIASWLLLALDVDSNGSITRQELMENLPKVMRNAKELAHGGECSLVCEVPKV